MPLPEFASAVRDPWGSHLTAVGHTAAEQASKDPSLKPFGAQGRYQNGNMFWG